MAGVSPAAVEIGTALRESTEQRSSHAKGPGMPGGWCDPRPTVNGESRDRDCTAIAISRSKIYLYTLGAMAIGVGAFVLLGTGAAELDDERWPWVSRLLLQGGIVLGALAPVFLILTLLGPREGLVLDARGVQVNPMGPFLRRFLRWEEIESWKISGAAGDVRYLTLQPKATVAPHEGQEAGGRSSWPAVILFNELELPCDEVEGIITRYFERYWQGS
jgi:hypothetical protein